MTDQHTRRRFLGNFTTGLMGVGLGNLLARETPSATRGLTHFEPKAKRVLQIFCPGAASHMDLWEHKPMLEKMHGQAAARRRGHGLVPGEEWHADEEPVGICRRLARAAR